MKDLFVWTADADAQAVMQQVLSRHQAMGTRAITFEVDRHVGRDSGMVKDGPELTQFKKGSFARLLLLLDHHGSGKEKEPVDAIQKQLSSRLDRVTWQDTHLVTIAVPELEEWLWHSPDALLKHLQIAEQEMNGWLAEFAGKTGGNVAVARRTQPKEMFEYLIRKKKQRKPSLNDFEQIAHLASLTGWQQGSTSFRAIAERLRQWFPPG